MNDSELWTLYLNYLKARLHPEQETEALSAFESAVAEATHGTMTVPEWQVKHELEMQEELERIQKMLENQPKGIHIIGTVK